jgi:hypothetical protein
MPTQWSKWLTKNPNMSQLPQQVNYQYIGVQLVQELVESEVAEIKETKDINPETTESGAVELDSVEIREEHDETRHLNITPYKSMEENVGSFDFNDPTLWPNVNDRMRCCLVEHGPDRGMDSDFRTSVSEDRRRLS